MSKQLVLSNNRIVAFGEVGDFVAMGGTVVCEASGKRYDNATIAIHDGEIPCDINSVGYEYAGGEFIPCAPFGEDDGDGYIMVACKDCATPKRSWRTLNDILGAELNVYAHAGTTITIRHQETNKSFTIESSGYSTDYLMDKYTLSVPKFGWWEIKAEYKGMTAYQSVGISECKQFHVEMGATLSVIRPSTATTIIDSDGVKFETPDKTEDYGDVASTEKIDSFYFLVNTKIWEVTIQDGEKVAVEFVQMHNDSREIYMSFLGATITANYPRGAMCVCYMETPEYSGTKEIELELHDYGISSDDLKGVKYRVPKGVTVNVGDTIVFDLSAQISTGVLKSDGTGYETADLSLARLGVVTPNSAILQETSNKAGEQLDRGRILVTAEGPFAFISGKRADMTSNPFSASSFWCEGFTAQTVPKGSAIVANDGTGTTDFAINTDGTWSITATDGDDIGQTSVVIDTAGQEATVTIQFARIYGIKRNKNNSAVQWTRTHDAEGLNATATKGTVEGNSDFDALYPWSDISATRKKVGTAVDDLNTVAKIPKFWFKRGYSGAEEYIQICDQKKQGFSLHPAFYREGRELDYIYIGRFKTCNGKSPVISNLTSSVPDTNLSMFEMRTKAKSWGEGWGLIDIHAISAIQMLYLVEFANSDVQATIGHGVYGGTSPLNVTSCEAITGYSSTADSGTADVCYRYIEGLWGNVAEFTEGVLEADRNYYVCNKIDYSNVDPTEWVALSYKCPKSDYDYIVTEGHDTGENVHIMLPDFVGGSHYTYYPDGHFLLEGSTISSPNVLVRGGDYSPFLSEGRGEGNGLFTTEFFLDATTGDPKVGSRLMYIPPEGAE